MGQRSKSRGTSLPNRDNVRLRTRVRELQISTGKCGIRDARLRSCKTITHFRPHTCRIIEMIPRTHIIYLFPFLVFCNTHTSMSKFYVVLSFFGCLTRDLRVLRQKFNWILVFSKHVIL